MTGTQDKMSNHIFQTNEIIDDNTHKKKIQKPSSYSTQYTYIYFHIVYTAHATDYISYRIWKSVTWPTARFFIFVMA